MTAPPHELTRSGRAVPVISPAPVVPVADFGPLDRLQGWAMTAVITALAAVTRFLNLGSPTDAGTPIFDEKHYAPQAWQMVHNKGLEDNPGYGLVVHPPVGKQLIAIGEAIFGYNGLGWRFSGAVCGVILVLLVTRIARRISRSTLVGGIAGLLLIADGVSFVTSRTALLDGFLTFFVVAAFGCLIVDRDQIRERMHTAFLEGRIAQTPWGPRLGVRWWRFGAGVLLEEFAGSDTLRALLPRLGELSQHVDARVRADACHYLGLTGDAAARIWLEARLDDEDADVREIAAESLQGV